VFKLLKKDESSLARLGQLVTQRGVIDTPVFMPVGTQGSVKALDPRELREMGTQIILGNTYHLHIRPGLDIIRAAGGLHRFINWPGPILTDSGGFQVFSLASIRKSRHTASSSVPILMDRFSSLAPKKPWKFSACSDQISPWFSMIVRRIQAPPKKYAPPSIGRFAGRKNAVNSRERIASKSSESSRAAATLRCAKNAPRLSWGWNSTGTPLAA